MRLTQNYNTVQTHFCHRLPLDLPPFLTSSYGSTAVNNRRAAMAFIAGTPHAFHTSGLLTARCPMASAVLAITEPSTPTVANAASIARTSKVRAAGGGIAGGWATPGPPAGVTGTGGNGSVRANTASEPGWVCHGHLKIQQWPHPFENATIAQQGMMHPEYSATASAIPRTNTVKGVLRWRYLLAAQSVPPVPAAPSNDHGRRRLNSPQRRR